ncbi:RecBCD enzyme subunit RecC [Baekduia alba]|uniref:exodeoxyribonuclease V subunit gamma n=1 Tax=Baekduia alba TaxID=2997333 RepID=UPI002341AA2D|nr:exodeoxyribonuclease V subunit gamma [Baekduia alba]WCB92982.1 RecBCD enzyme subunit RecC [Baekduia alba]
MLHLHRADRADRLVGALAAVLAEPLADPFAPEVVAVPTRGVERWLTQQLSSTLGATDAGARPDGICANVAFPTPRRLVDDAVAAGSGFDPDRDPWLPARTVWPLLASVDEHLHDAWLERLRHHLEPGRGDRSRRLRAVQHLAGLFDRYAIHRPQMLAAWHAGDDVDASATGTPLPDHERWQAELWRRLRARIGQPGPAERLQLACRELVVDPDRSDLPPRLALFGLTSLPARHLEVLRALAEGGRDVHLFLLQPSDASWQRVRQALDERDVPAAREDTTTPGLLPGNPLLASWGRDARELQMTLARAGTAASDQHHQVDRPASPATLLQRVQADVRADRVPTLAEAEAAADGSLQIHACHGANRQVDVLRDAILHALQRDPTLEPRDVIVMCPDIETFAPLIQATFGAGEDADDGARLHDLRVRLADRSLRETNPVLGVVARLLELTSARATASEVLDLADRESVRRRFRFAQDDMSRLEDWVAASGTRWGFDTEQRKDYNLAGVAQGTWAAGLDRLLTGVALTEDEPRLLSGVVPLDDVDSSTIDLAGRFAEYVERLKQAVDDFAVAKPIDAWVVALADAADALTATSPADVWQRAELQRVLADVLDEATADDDATPTPTTTLDVADVAALLETRLAGRPTRANFRTGHLTVCTLQPMRSVPHRVVCLLGLDDTVFPRRSPRDGDDLLIAAPHVGDRDARSEDRQILLDALLAAEDRLIVTYTGNDERTNAERAPAVPVAELLDVVERTAGAAARDAIVVRHPLQPFDARNFTPGALAPDAAAWSFDETALAGAQAMASDRLPPPPFLAGPLPPAAAQRDLVELEDLVAFLGHPVRAFLRQRLGIGAGTRTEEVDDALPIDLDFRAQWAIGDRLLRARLLGADGERAREAERARGTLPPCAIGARRLDLLDGLADAIAGAARREIPDLDTERQVRDVRVGLADGRRLGGTVSGLSGDVVQLVTFSRINARHRLGAWARVLALTAAAPERRFAAVTVGRARRSVQRYKQLTIARIPPVVGATPEERRAAARAELAILVDLYDRGMREPLPLYCETSAAFAAAGDNRRTGRRAAEQQWTTAFGEAGREDVDPDHVRVLGGILPFDALLEDSPRADEAWGDDEPTRLGRYAHRLWSRLLAVEEVTDR